jgi:predicted Fe-Mo cluster-binding NifX family protein
MKEKQANSNSSMRFAFAVSKHNEFEEKHFGDCDTFQIYEIEKQKTTPITKVKNTFKILEHGTQNKGDLITNVLKKENVNVLVSMQFGKNIKIINKHFIPIIIHSSKLEEVIKVLEKHIHWIEDEWNNRESNYQLFTINQGIIKANIK